MICFTGWGGQTHWTTSACTPTKGMKVKRFRHTGTTSALASRIFTEMAGCTSKGTSYLCGVAAWMGMQSGEPCRVSNGDTPSGFGFELTFRLRKEPDETGPPTWPAAVMQGLAKYVFQSGNVLCDGDHVSWHCPLDNSESRIEHMLMMEDPQLGTVATPFGPVSFVQVSPFGDCWRCRQTNAAHLCPDHWRVCRRAQGSAAVERPELCGADAACTRGWRAVAGDQHAPRRDGV